MCCGWQALGVLGVVPVGDLVLKEEIFLPTLMTTLLSTHVQQETRGSGRRPWTHLHHPSERHL